MLALAAGCGEPPLRARAPSPGAPHFTIASYNLEIGGDGAPDTLAAIDAIGADIACLQEVTPAAEGALRARYTERYPYQVFKSKGGAGGIAVLSRFPLSEGILLAAPEGWHPALLVDAQTPAGRVQVLNVHLRSLFSGDSDPFRSLLNTDADHLDEMIAFSDKCEQDVPTIVLGDFNEGVDGEAVQLLEGRGFINLLPAFHPGQPTWGFRSVGDQLGATIDHVLINDHLVPLDSWVKRYGDSDHLPVMAHVQPRSW